MSVNENESEISFIIMLSVHSFALSLVILSIPIRLSCRSLSGLPRFSSNFSAQTTDTISKVVSCLTKTLLSVRLCAQFCTLRHDSFLSLSLSWNPFRFKVLDFFKFINDFFLIKKRKQSTLFILKYFMENSF